MEDLKQRQQMKAFEENLLAYGNGNPKTLQFAKDLLEELESRGAEISYRYSPMGKCEIPYYTSECQFYLSQDPENMSSFVVDAYKDDLSSVLFFVAGEKMPMLVL